MEILKNNKTNMLNKISIPNKANILPCPFCGYNHISFLMDEYDNPVYPWYSQCQMCGAGAKRGKTLEDAVKEWNKRANNG